MFVQQPRLGWGTAFTRSDSARLAPEAESRVRLRVMRLSLSAILLCLAWAMPLSAQTPGDVEVGGKLREATLQGLNGPSRKLSEFRGRPLVINFWASWCGPCRQEMGSLERLAWREEARQFTVIGISTDDYPDAAKAFLHKANATFNHFIDSRLTMENMLGANRLPLTVLVDAQGRVLDKIYGAREWDSPESLNLLRKSFQIPHQPK
jgi:thiol-disulfide isomerase/thioredoxin